MLGVWREGVDMFMSEAGFDVEAGVLDLSNSHFVMVYYILR